MSIYFLTAMVCLAICMICATIASVVNTIYLIQQIKDKKGDKDNGYRERKNRRSEGEIRRQKR